MRTYAISTGEALGSIPARYVSQGGAVEILQISEERKMKTKYWVLGLCVVLLFATGLVACGQQAQEPEQPSQEVQQSEPVTMEPTTTPEPVETNEVEPTDTVEPEETTEPTNEPEV